MNRLDEDVGGEDELPGAGLDHRSIVPDAGDHVGAGSRQQAGDRSHEVIFVRIHDGSDGRRVPGSPCWTAWRRGAFSRL